MSQENGQLEDKRTICEKAEKILVVFVAIVALPQICGAAYLLYLFSGATISP